jgi:hypothetical protein
MKKTVFLLIMSMIFTLSSGNIKANQTALGPLVKFKVRLSEVHFEDNGISYAFQGGDTIALSAVAFENGEFFAYSSSIK